MRFNLQTITVTDEQERSYQIDALVALQEDGTPVGLAVHPVYELGPGSLTPTPDEYTLTHLSSGVRLHRDPVCTQAIACRWLERVAPLADWTQPRALLCEQHTLRLQVRVARVRARWDEDEEELDLWDEGPDPLPQPASLFTAEAVTSLIEWSSHAMEYVAPPAEAMPALEALLALHTELARQQHGIMPQTLPCIWRFASCRRAYDA